MRSLYTDFKLPATILRATIMSSVFFVSTPALADQGGEFPPSGYGLELEKVKKPETSANRAVPAAVTQPAKAVVPASTLNSPPQQARTPYPQQQPRLMYPAQTMPQMSRPAPQMMPWPYAQRPALQQPYGYPMMPQGGSATPWLNNRMIPMQRPAMNYPVMPGGYYPNSGYPLQQQMQRPMQPGYNSYPAAPAMPAYPYPYPAQGAAAPMINAPAMTAAPPAGQRPVYPMRKKIEKEKHAWGEERNIWDDFYTDFTGDMWDSMINAPFDVGRMPGGWRAPSFSSPDPVTIGDAVTNQIPPMVEEMGNMTDFSN